MTDFLALHAREKMKLPEDWIISSWRVHPGPNSDYEHPSMVEIQGAVYPMLTKGKRAGSPNWKKPVLGSYAVVFFTPGEHSAFIHQWEEKTGLCSACEGTTLEVCGWSSVEGIRKRPCLRCGATGMSAPSPAQEGEPR